MWTDTFPLKVQPKLAGMKLLTSGSVKRKTACKHNTILKQKQKHKQQQTYIYIYLNICKSINNDSQMGLKEIQYGNVATKHNMMTKHNSIH